MESPTYWTNWLYSESENICCCPVLIDVLYTPTHIRTVAASVLTVLNVYLSICIYTYHKHKTRDYFNATRGDSSRYKIPFLNMNFPPPPPPPPPPFSLSLPQKPLWSRVPPHIRLCCYEGVSGQSSSTSAGLCQILQRGCLWQLVTSVYSLYTLLLWTLQIEDTRYKGHMAKISI